MTIKTRVCEVAAIAADDGLVFDTRNARVEVIREENVYSGIRVRLAARLATAQLTFHVDVNVGDPVWPAPTVVPVPRILGGTVEVLGYPLAMVHAEKLVTALQRGTANTRWRDFVDIAALARTQPIEAADLATSIAKIASFRQVAVGPLAPILVGYGAIASNAGQPGGDVSFWPTEHASRLTSCSPTCWRLPTRC